MKSKSKLGRIFYHPDLTDKQNFDVQNYIIEGSKNSNDAIEYTNFITQHGEIMLAHIELRCRPILSSDIARFDWTDDYRDELNLLLKASYPKVKLPIDKHDNIDCDDMRNHFQMLDQQMVLFSVYNEFCFTEKDPLLHILVNVKPTAFLNIKDGLMECLLTIHEENPTLFKSVHVERITSTSNIIQKMKMHGKDRFFREI